MTKSLHRRIKRLEKTSGGEVEMNLRVVAERLGIPVERLIALPEVSKKQLKGTIGANGTITWEGFCYLRDLRLFE